MDGIEPDSKEMAEAIRLMRKSIASTDKEQGLRYQADFRLTMLELFTNHFIQAREHLLRTVEVDARRDDFDADAWDRKIDQLGELADNIESIEEWFKEGQTELASVDDTMLTALQIQRDQDDRIQELRTRIKAVLPHL